MGVTHDLEFDKQAESFTRFLLRCHPTTATHIGIHDFDEELADFSAKGIRTKQEKLESYGNIFRKINKRAINPDNKINLELILARIDLELLMSRKFPVHKLVPDIYLNEVLFGVYFLISRDFAPVRRRALSATRRLAHVPNLLNHAKKNLKAPPDVFIESALHTCNGALIFLRESLPEFAGSIRGSLKEALLEVNDEATAAIDRFSTLLSDTLAPRAKGNFAVGKTLYNQLLKLEHKLPYTHDDLLKIARREIKKIKAELDEVAAKISKKKSWQELVEDLKTYHPTAPGLVGVYKREIKRVRNFIIDKDLVTFPPGEVIEVVPTPPFARALTPYAAYLSPAPFDNRPIGQFWVTVPTGMPAKAAKERLKGHCKWGLPVKALHEAYPGHHLQLCRANEIKFIIRHLVQTPVFAEGWAFYCEEMMWEQGFYKDPRERLLQLKDALWRAYRVLIDVGLHTKTMKIDEAVRILVETVGLEPPNAEAEVLRYCLTPTQPMSYLIGKVELVNLLNDYRKKAGRRFDLKEFHDELLSYGTIPISSIRTLMGL